MCRAVKLRGNSTGHAPKVSPSQRSESVKLRGNSRVSRGVSPLGGVPNLASGVASARVESVKLRRNSTGRAGHASSRLRPCRIRQAKGELHRARVQVSGHASRCRLPPVSKRPQSVRAVKLRGNSTIHVSRCQGMRPGVASRPCRSVRKAFACVAWVCRAVKLQGTRPGVASARVESGKLRGNSTGHTSRCRLPVSNPSS